MLEIPIENKEAVLELVRKFGDNFASHRIVYLGLHGSSRYHPIFSVGISDIDLELILDEVFADDLSRVRSIVADAPLKIECQVRSLEEIEDQNSIIAQTHYKIFMFWAYRNAITLIGSNPYVTLVGNFTDEDYSRSLLLSIQIAWKDLRKNYIARKSDLDLNKLVEIILFDLLLYTGRLDYRDLDKEKIFKAKRYDVYALAAEKFGEVLLEGERQSIRDYAGNHERGVFSAEIFDCLNDLLKSFVKA